MSYFTQYVTAGEIVLDGTDFRNVAHLRFKADILVPCGGRYVFFPLYSLLGCFTDISLPGPKL